MSVVADHAPRPAKRVSVAIIGAGYSGLSAAIHLLQKQPSLSVTILEQSFSLGGTWTLNRYPGCACDVWSALYSFSFAPNTAWSRLYPQRAEILNYMRDVARRYGVDDCVRYGCAVRGARWDDGEKLWALRVDEAVCVGGEWTGRELRVQADYVISGVGQLNVPYTPDIAGRDRFRGVVMHSARWDEAVDVSGKRVAVIGNGATAAQIVPELAKVVGRLTVYQRTPNWVSRRDDARIPKVIRWLLAVVPGLMKVLRTMQFWIREATHNFIAYPKGFVGRMIRQQCLDAMHKALPGRQDLWQKLTPEYDIGCKRILMCDDYYPALARDNVRLETRKIQQITEKGIEVVDEGEKGIEEEEYDIVVMATGFRTNDFLGTLDIQGRGGRQLKEVWNEAGGPRAYLGVTIEEMPNFSVLYGPNTNLGHNSIIAMIEAQSRYIRGIVEEVVKASEMDSKLVMTPKKDTVNKWNELVQERLKHTSFADERAGSWYKTGEGKIVNNWFGTVVEYQKALQRVDWSDYDIEGHNAGTLHNKKKSVGRVREDLPVSPAVLKSTLIGAFAIASAMLWRKRKSA